MEILQKVIHEHRQRLVGSKSLYTRGFPTHEEIKGKFSLHHFGKESEWKCCNRELMDIKTCWFKIAKEMRISYD